VKKVVLIAPPNDFAGNANVVRFTLPLAPPLGILAVGSYLSMHNVPVELIDVQMDFGFGLTHNAERVVFQRVIHHLRDQVDDIAWIGFSQLSNSGSGFTLAQEIHDAFPDIPIIFGGYCPSSTYRTMLRNYPFITAIVRGDGEATALEISRNILEDRPFPSRQTPNLAWLNGEEILTTPIQQMALDDLPTLDFRLLHNPHSYQIINLMTSRGCPFQCNYCLENCMRHYATHSPQWVRQQLAHLESELPNERIFVYDPIFGLGRERTLELCQILREHRFAYAVESRADVLEPDLVPILRETNIESIYLGIESASKETLVRMNKVRSADSAERYLNNTREILKACFENDATPVVGFMLGFPGDSEADYQASAEFVKAIGRIHSETVSQTEVETGFVPFVFFTKVYEGSLLAECVEKDFPEATLRPEPFIGEKAVISPSPGLGLDTTQRYQAEIVRNGAYTPLALERLCNYYIFSMETFLENHPELTDSEGVTVVGDSLRRFPQEITIASMFLNFDKSKS
jgi:radical SAM superfamily enzyme YgiQ (UPF0313 family)